MAKDPRAEPTLAKYLFYILILLSKDGMVYFNKLKKMQETPIKIMILMPYKKALTERFFRFICFWKKVKKLMSHTGTGKN